MIRCWNAFWDRLENYLLNAAADVLCRAIKASQEMK